MPLRESLRHTLKYHRLLQGGERVVVAVSGGPDSLCLLHLLWRLREELGLRLHVAHLDHGFRGEQSAAEARFVAEFAHQHGLPATVERRDVMALLGGKATNKQAAARAVRYAFLAEVAAQEEADAVAVAHHADDQAETVLLHLLRGAGPGGLRGMRRRVPWAEWSTGFVAMQSNRSRPEDLRPALIRPLLDISRAAIEEYCATWGLDPRRDPSNKAMTAPRSRIRHDLIPLLSEYNRHITAALARTAAICADDYAYMQEQLDHMWPTLAEETPGRISFSQKSWGPLHPALQRYALRRAISLLAPGAEPSFEQIEGLRGAMGGESVRRPDLPRDIGLLAAGSSWWLELPPGPTQSTPDGSAPQLVAPLPVLVPGATAIGPRWQLIAATEQPAAWRADRWGLVIDRDALVGPLALRARRPGDRFRPAGGAGSRLLQDFFVDRKIDRSLRDQWPLLTSGDAIIWVVGLRPDSRFLPSPTTQHHLWLRVEDGEQREEARGKW